MSSTPFRLSVRRTLGLLAVPALTAAFAATAFADSTPAAAPSPTPAAAPAAQPSAPAPAPAPATAPATATAPSAAPPVAAATLGAAPAGESAWFKRVDKAQASQPHWMTPLVTVTPRLEEEYRYDQYWEGLGNGGHLDNYDAGKGLELIPTTTNEILLNPPPYEVRTVKKPAEGFGDWPFLTIKQRIISGNEQNGNYIVTAFLGFQAGTGVKAFTSDTWLITPTLAAGKGWGNFDVQGTFGVPIPTRDGGTIGSSETYNLAAQYHLDQYFWPEFEMNTQHWSSGERVGKTQIFLTPGIVLGRFHITGRYRAIVGVGYQFAVSPKQVLEPMTPTYNHNWILSTRLAF